MAGPRSRRGNSGTVKPEGPARPTRVGLRTGIEGHFVRDGRAPVPLTEVTSRVMSANQAKGTAPERTVRAELARSGIGGFRLNWIGALGRPDVAFPGSKVAIFVNGCYWHRCPRCAPRLPKTHRAFWRRKFKQNMARDRETLRALHLIGWKVLVIWECEIRSSPDSLPERVRAALAS